MREKAAMRMWRRKWWEIGKSWTYLRLQLWLERNRRKNWPSSSPKYTASATESGRKGEWVSFAISNTRSTKWPGYSVGLKRLTDAHSITSPSGSLPLELSKNWRLATTLGLGPLKTAQTMLPPLRDSALSLLQRKILISSRCSSTMPVSQTWKWLSNTRPRVLLLKKKRRNDLAASSKFTFLIYLSWI